jgi:hypothetical protein
MDTEDDPLCESIEEEIIINNEMSPAFTAAQKKGKAAKIDTSGRPPIYNKKSPPHIHQKAPVVQEFDGENQDPKF